MLRLILHISFILVFFQSMMGQVRIIKPVKTHPRYTDLAVSAGVIRSDLFLTRNVNTNNDAIGFTGGLVYGGGRSFRLNLEYAHYRKMNIKPTWYDIKASSIELNANILAQFKKTKTFFYPLFGISYNSFQGYFTGLNDFLFLATKYEKNAIARTNWLGVNVGAGFEQKIKHFAIFGEYKMRIGNSGPQLNILDVCFSAGLRYNFRVPSVYKLFSGTRNRYILESKETED